MKTEQIPQIEPNLTWRVLNEETVVVSPNDGKYCVLNGLGTVIWQRLSEQNSLEGIEKYLVTNYEVSEEQAREDIGRFLSDLSQKGLLVWGS
jgi:hypothetical protein